MKKWKVYYVCVYHVRCSPQRRRADQGCCVWVLTGQIRARGLRCRTGRLRCLVGPAGRMAHLSRAPGPSLARRNKTLLSVREKRLSIIKCIVTNPTYINSQINNMFWWEKGVELPVAPAALSSWWTAERQTASLLFLSLVSGVFLSLLPPEDQGTHTSYIFKSTQTQRIWRKDFNLIRVYSKHLCLSVCGYSQVLCSIKEQQGADRWDVAWQTAQPLLCLILRLLLLAHTHGEIHQLLLKGRRTGRSESRSVKCQLNLE